MNTPLLSAAAHRARTLLSTQLSTEHRYHNIGHTESVVAAVELLGTRAGLPEATLEKLLLAAWFHDTGFVRTYTGHEEVSQELLEEFLRAQGYPTDYVPPAYIAVTHAEQVPADLATGILKDADYNNLGSAEYFTATRNLRYEWTHFLQRTFTDRGWLSYCVQFLQTHQYYTPAGLKLFGPRKAVHLRKMLDLYKEAK